jgi:hypothetical protein
LQPTRPGGSTPPSALLPLLTRAALAATGKLDDAVGNDRLSRSIAIDADIAWTSFGSNAAPLRNGTMAPIFLLRLVHPNDLDADWTQGLGHTRPKNIPKKPKENFRVGTKAY